MRDGVVCNAGAKEPINNNVLLGPRYLHPPLFSLSLPLSPGKGKRHDHHCSLCACLSRIAVLCFDFRLPDFFSSSLLCSLCSPHRLRQPGSSSPRVFFEPKIRFWGRSLPFPSCGPGTSDCTNQGPPGYLNPYRYHHHSLATLCSLDHAIPSIEKPHYRDTNPQSN